MNNIIEIIVQEMKLHNYSQRTIDAYIFVVKGLSRQTIPLCTNSINYFYMQD